MTSEEVRRSIDEYVEQEVAKIISDATEFDFAGHKLRLVSSPLLADGQVLIFQG